MWDLVFGANWLATLGSVVPVPHRPLAPARLRIGKPVPRRREARACDANDRDGSQPLQEVERGKGAIGNQNQGAVG